MRQKVAGGRAPPRPTANPLNKLVDAYVKARYSKHCRIDVETLEWLIERIEMLHGAVEVACAERLEKLKRKVGKPAL